MGMLTEEDYEIAAMNNIENWDFDVNGAYPMPKEEAEAVLKILETRKAQRMMNSLRGK